MDPQHDSMFHRLARPCRRVALISTLILLQACGGGGGGQRSPAPLTPSPPSPPPPPAAPTLQFTVSSGKVAAGDSATLTWSSANATGCTASGAWSGSLPPNGTATTKQDVVGKYTYTLACTGAGGTVSKSLELTVAPKLWATSYQNFKTIGLTPQSLRYPQTGNARAYADFSGQGTLDLIALVPEYDAAKPVSEAKPAPIRFWSRQSDGAYVSNPALPELMGCIHPRKALVSDYNGDARPDAFIVCHGYDAPPYPGERNRLVLSQAAGGYQARDAAPDVSFWHGGAAADIDGDGDVDVVAVSFFDPEHAVTFLNDGSGNFRREAPSRFPTGLGDAYNSLEIVDVDEDGKLDVLLGGHEMQNARTLALLNPGNGDFRSVIPVVLPAIPGHGVVLDFTVTGSGATRSVWVVRTTDGTSQPPYQGRLLQRIDWSTRGSAVALHQPSPADWIDWAIPAVINGKNVITSDKADRASTFTLEY